MNEALEGMFTTHRVYRDKDFLDFLNERFGVRAVKQLKKEPTKWLEELRTLFEMTSQESLYSVTGVNAPPNLEQAGVQPIGKDMYRLRERSRKAGLWTKIHRPEIDIFGTEVSDHTWRHIPLSNRGTVSLNNNYPGLSAEWFNPDILEQNAILIKSDAAPVYDYVLPNDEQVYAKGSRYNTVIYNDKPAHRLTNFAALGKRTAEDQAVLFTRMRQEGVHTPDVVAMYESPHEDFLYTAAVSGDMVDVDHISPQERTTIIEQDAQMLAVLCRFGKRKLGFTDFDDKVFDGEKLTLIDVDEVIDDMYDMEHIDFRALVFDPLNTRALEEFRIKQRAVFDLALKDTMFKYKDTLVREPEDYKNYVGSFYRTMGWEVPTDMDRLITYSPHYMTWESAMAMSNGS